MACYDTQLEKQREAAAKAKLAKRAAAGLVARNDGPGKLDSRHVSRFSTGKIRCQGFKLACKLVSYVLLRSCRRVPGTGSSLYAD